jgi:hypothetical protein
MLDTLSLACRLSAMKNNVNFTTSSQRTFNRFTVEYLLVTSLCQDDSSFRCSIVHNEYWEKRMRGI